MFEITARLRPAADALRIRNIRRSSDRISENEGQWIASSFVFRPRPDEPLP